VCSAHQTGGRWLSKRKKTTASLVTNAHVISRRRRLGGRWWQAVAASCGGVCWTAQQNPLGIRMRSAFPSSQFSPPTNLRRLTWLSCCRMWRHVPPCRRNHAIIWWSRQLSTINIKKFWRKSYTVIFFNCFICIQAGRKGKLIRSGYTQRWIISEYDFQNIIVV
jgi:hypothetical protein